MIQNKLKRRRKRRIKNQLINPIVAISIAVVASALITINAPSLETTVVRVIDGDTIVVMYRGEEERVRLIGIDTPENNEVGADKATIFTREMIEGAGSQVYLATSGNDRDQFGRLRRYVYLENPENSNDIIPLNQMLLDAGHAVVWGD